jgi:acetate kinase
MGAVGHRVIHGGDEFTEPVLIDDKVIAAIDALSELAPLHNQPSLNAIGAVREMLGRDVPMVAVFDTAFHRTLPTRAYHYAIPQKLAAKHRIRRYGFHGLAHRYMTERYATITATPLEQVKLITLQLGNGCSATAVANGRSVDTSMGFTPLEGLMMGTRSGDVDPTLAGFLARREGVPIADVTNWLNTRSGLLGVSGRSRDMRELLAAEREGDEMAALAIDMFCYRIKKYIGSYLTILNGADAIIFSGGIGENAAEVRARILAGMEWCGLKLDGERNIAAIGCENHITADDTRLPAYVIPVDEALIIARDTVSFLENRPKKQGSR